jgi:hypothetical protein
VIEPVAYSIVALVAAGMAASFYAADPRSPTSRSLSLLWLLLGIAMVLNILACAGRAKDASLVPFWHGPSRYSTP